MRRFHHLKEEFLSVFLSEISVSHTKPVRDAEKGKDLDNGHQDSVKEVLSAACPVHPDQSKGLAVDLELTTFTVQHTGMLECKAATSQHEDCV